jgi:hypothetical protein
MRFLVYDSFVKLLNKYIGKILTVNNSVIFLLFDCTFL